MANQDNLHNWWWIAGPQQPGPFTVQQIEQNLQPAKAAGVAKSNKGGPVSLSGWNYAILKFLMQKCALPQSLQAILQTGAQNYGIWRQHMTVGNILINPLVGANQPPQPSAPALPEPGHETVHVRTQNIVSLSWKRFFSFSEAVAESAAKPVLYMQTSCTGLILRIGKAAEGLSIRYNAGYQKTIDAAMWESGNMIFTAVCGADVIETIEATMIAQISPTLNVKQPVALKEVVVSHSNIVIQGSRVTAYWHQAFAQQSHSPDAQNAARG
jgi:hypothetical protein